MLWAGGLFLAVTPQNTSQTCPSCGHISRDNRKSQAAFACVKCDFADNADLVGAINVLRAGYARIACEVNGEESRQQQEPTERAAKRPSNCTEFIGTSVLARNQSAALA